MKPETIARSIYWQRHVMATTTDPTQRERCRRAIEKLTAQLIAAQQLTTWPFPPFPNPLDKPGQIPAPEPEPAPY